MRLWRGALIHTLLLVAALVTAFFIWRSPQDEQNREARVPLWPPDGLAAEALIFRNERQTFTLAPGDKGRLWLTVQPAARAVAPAATAATPEAPPATPEPPATTAVPSETAEPPAATAVPTPTPAATAAADPAPPPARSFLANARAARLLAGFAAPLARRSLGVLPAEGLAALGLAPPEATLTVRRAGGKRRLEFGRLAFGAPDRYARRPDTGEVFLAPRSLADDMRLSETLLVESDPFGQGGATPDRVRVDAGGMTVTFVRLGATKPAPDEHAAHHERDIGRWARADAPEKPDAAAGAWVATLLSVRVRDYVRTEGAAAEPALAVEVGVAGAQPVRVAFFASSAEGGAYYALESSALGVPARTAAGPLDGLLRDLKTPQAGPHD